MLIKIKRYLREPRFALGCDLISRHPDWMSDRFWIETLYRLRFGEKLNLKNPKSFNEKLQWLKLYDKNPLYPVIVDKITAKDWVAKRIGQEYINPILNIYDSVDDISIDNLPESFVLKCNHDSGSAIICRDKRQFDLVAAKKILDNALQHNYFYESREWPYKGISPKVFTERFLGEGLIDYKFFTFNGKVRLLLVITNGGSENHGRFYDFYDSDFRHMDVTHGHPNSAFPPTKPQRFNEMKDLAETLGQGFPHVRVDFYDTPSGVFFSEMTLYSSGGLVPFDPPKFDLILGKYLHLPMDAD